MDPNTALCRSFVRQAKEALSAYPHLTHEWSIDDDQDHCILDIPEECEDGFPITTEVHPKEITVIAGPAHMHFDLEGDVDELAAQVLGLVRDLLSPAMRIHEFLAGGKAYKWTVEADQNGKWIAEQSLGLIIFRWFGYRTERICQNRILPARQRV